MKKKSLLLLWVCFNLLTTYSFSQTWNPNHRIGTIDGVYNFSYNQSPPQLVEIYGAAIPNTGLSYQWESTTTPTGTFTSISGATSSSYTFSSVLSQTTYFRRKSTYTSNGSYIYSNVVKLSVVSVNWEDRNYIRVHDVLKTGYTTWQQVDQLAIGDKLQATTYLDGLGRGVEKVSRETATPANPNNLWGDIVQFTQYDVYGRQPKQYLPYTTTTQSGKFKTSPSTEQTSYYNSIYNETSPFSNATYDNSPLNRVTNVKQPGTTWASAAGNTGSYDMNDPNENVQMFSVDYIQGDAPINNGAYPAKTLYKITYSDENGKKVIEYIDKTGRLILKKVQLDDNPSVAHSGWICTYNVYDDFGLLRFQLPGEAVNYLDGHSWSFAGTDGQNVLNGLCFQYNYDDKGRAIWKKTPGADPLNMLYDVRDRIVLMQDGNQAAIQQWTASLYDELDRPVLSTLYNISASIATLQSNINTAATTSSVTISGNPNPVSVTTTLSLNPISSSNLNNSSVCTILQYSFYDNYSFYGIKTFNNSFTVSYSTSDPNVQPVAKTLRTLSAPTGSLVRVLGSTTFLASTFYYDERGSHIQTLEDNVKSGTDITTIQYHFDGRVLSSCNDHTTPSTGYTNFQTITKYLFDKLGRVTSIQKKFGSNDYKTVSVYDYDDVGRVKNKHLDPNYNNPNSGQADLESLGYTFNIHNQLTGINKDYALKNPSNYNKWAHFFGLYLGYDNRDNVFTTAQLNGQVTGALWNTQGDDAQRKYDYSYDNAGRLIKAIYKEKQHTSDSWSNSLMDFSVKGNGTNEQITYDLNGNLLSMLQRGVVPGNSSPIDIDKLVYSYAQYSNKLTGVTDQMATPSVNGKFGDFKDGSNGGDDYVYDANGNLVIDLNKDVHATGNTSGNGVHYNYLDKPDQIKIIGKGTIDIVYSASGEKLKRTFTPETGTAVTTTYINQFVYQNSTGTDQLAYINFEEGRIRVITPTAQTNGYDYLNIDGNMDLPNSKKGVYDYYILDYQQNVRMILTEQTQSASNICTMETSRATAEEPVFGQVGSANEVSVTRYPTTSTSWTGNTTASVSRLGNLSTHNVGPNVLQKVMAGDKVTATVQYYFQTSTGGSNSGFASALLGSLVQAISSNPAAPELVHNSAANISSQLNINYDFLGAIQPGTTGNTPQAYLTILFFDERFNFVGSADGGVAQQQVASSVGSNGSTLGLLNIKAPKNGYAYVYVSNQSDQDVYFDNMQVGIVNGNIIEENHYYAYGLKISAISSKKFPNANEGEIKNKYQYQGAFNEFDDDISWNDFALRNYDPQIGRWIEQDPYQEYPSPYTGMGNDPINLIDPSGGVGIPCPGTSAFAIFLDNAIFAIGNALQRINNIGTAVNIVASVSNTAINVGSSIQASNVINSQIQTPQAGDPSDGTNTEDNGVTVREVLLYGSQLSQKFQSLMNDNGITIDNNWKINIVPGLLVPYYKDGQIYLPLIPDKDLGVLWLSHEMSNLKKEQQYYQVDVELNQQLNSDDPKTKVMTPDEFATKKINIETESVVDRMIVEAESGIQAVDKEEQQAVEEYKKTKDIKKLREAAKKYVEKSKANGITPIRQWWKEQYENVKKTIQDRKKKAADEKKKKAAEEKKKKTSSKKKG